MELFGIPTDLVQDEKSPKKSPPINPNTDVINMQEKEDESPNKPPPTNTNNTDVIKTKEKEDESPKISPPTNTNNTDVIKTQENEDESAKKPQPINPSTDVIKMQEEKEDEPPKKPPPVNPNTDEIKMKEKVAAFEKELSNFIGLESLKTQLQSWAKQMLLDVKRRALGIRVGDRNTPHMAFLGNPGTGKTTLARMLGKLLHMLDVIPKDKVVEVQRSDLVAEYVGQTAIKTRSAVQRALGGILFVDEAYRLMPCERDYSDCDYGLEALEEIMSFMDKREMVVIFAGYRKKMQNVIGANEGFRRRVTKFFYFDDFTCRELGDMALLKMSNAGQNSPLYGFKLHPSCTVESIEEMIRRESSEKQRRETNGGLVEMMLVNARESLDQRCSVDCEDIDSLTTITMEDLDAALQLIKKHSYRRIRNGNQLGKEQEQKKAKLCDK